MIRRDETEKREIIHLVEHSALSVKKTLDELQVPRSTLLSLVQTSIWKKESKGWWITAPTRTRSGIAFRRK